MLRVAFAALIFFATLAVITIRPYRVPEAGAAVGGALLMLLGGYLKPVEALAVLVREWNIYGFLLGLMAISALADQAGIFEALALHAGRWGRGDARALYVALFLIGVFITAFLSNDATALILTPVVYALVTRLRLPIMPFMFACTFIANTASFILPVSNPINVLVLDTFGGDLGTFLRYLLLPSLFAVGFNVALFVWLFRRELRLQYDPHALAIAPSDHMYFRLTLVVLGMIATGYVVASAIRLPVSFVALSGGALLLCVGYRHLDWRRLSRDISWSLFLFISGMFVIMRGVENLGLTAALGNSLLHLSGTDPLPAVLLAAGGTALGANLINNFPMALVMISALRTASTTVESQEALVYASALGADLGPNLTTVGSLATMLWLLILRRRGLEISTLEYLKLGVTTVPVMVVVGALLIWLQI